MRAILLALLLASPASAQWVFDPCNGIPVQCWGNSCCPPQYCQPCYPNNYAQPRQRISPDNQPTQPAPLFEPTPPQPTTPPIEKPAEPTISQKDWLDWVRQQQEKQAAEAARHEQTILILQKIEQKQGCNCQPTDLTPVLEAIKAIKVEVPPAPAPPATQAEQHIVVVADHNAPYWDRLSEKITTARKSYSGIQDTTLPAFPIGVHPQAVVYVNKVPVRIAKGLYEVENLLSRASRGESL